MTPELESMARSVEKAVARREATEQDLKRAKQTERDCQEALAEYMEEIGVTEFKTTDGAKITVGTKLKVSIPKASEATLKWLNENGYGALIKNEYKVRLELGESPYGLKRFLNDNGFDFDAKKTVHPQTITKWAKEIWEEGKDFPRELFNVFQHKYAKITR